MKSPGALLGVVFTLAMGLTGGMTAFAGLVKEEIVIRQVRSDVEAQYRDQLATQRWEFRGGEARRIGAGALALSLAGFLPPLGLWLIGTEPWRLRQKAILSTAILLQGAAVVLCFPPWRLSVPGVLPGFYAFLLPSLAGAIASFGRGAGPQLAGLAVGIALSAVLGRGAWRESVTCGGLGFIGLGSYLGVLFSPGFRAATLKRTSA
jgi:hypothetical protein